MKSRTILSLLFTVLFINLFGQDTTYSKVYPGTVVKFFEPVIVDDTLHLPPYPRHPNSKSEIKFTKDVKIFLPEKNQICFVRIIDTEEEMREAGVTEKRISDWKMTYDSPQLPTPIDVSTRNLNLAGFHLEKAGNHRLISTISLIVGSAISSLTILEQNSTGESSSSPLIIFGSCALISIGFKISGDSHEVKAGRILQGKSKRYM